jgi:lipopolysaccharide/colanic/teichoic acid biosynthesis glycosyltransferase
MCKRFIDLCLSVAGLIVFALPMLIISTLILIKMGRPIIFKQSRPGKGGVLFDIYKFRTMHNSTGEYLSPSENEQRITWLGRMLRESSLDELPELWNVLLGQMSLVGPRPLLPEYLSLYGRQEARRHEVLPGITGWAQINGRNSASWSDRFAMDIWYVDNRTCWLDIKIIIATIFTVLKRDGISSGDFSTISRYKGKDAKH